MDIRGHRIALLNLVVCMLTLFWVFILISLLPSENNLYNLNMDPSLNLIFKDHGLVSFGFHLYQPINIYGMKLYLTVLFPFVHALFLFLFLCFCFVWGVKYLT